MTDFFDRTKEKQYIIWGAGVGALFRIYSINPETVKSIYERTKYIEIINKALSDKNGFVSFMESPEQSSHISAYGDKLVECAKLDDFVEYNITFIKLDIEGSEIAAISGGSTLIGHYAPKLAVCVYHKPQDIWEVPILLHKINQNYKFYLRHHGPICIGTVLYATM